MVMKNETGPLRELLDSRVRVICLNKRNARYAGYAVFEIFRKESPKNVLCFNFELASLLVLSKLLGGFKTKIYLRVINTISLELSQNRFSNTKLLLRRVILNQLNGLIFQCNDMRKDFLRTISLKDRVETFVIYNPASFTHFSVNHNHNNNNIVFAGRLEKQKNIPLLLDAFIYAVRKRDDLKLHIYGEGSLRNFIKEEIVKNKIENSVFLHGFESKVSEIFDRKSLSLLTSVYEGFPNFLLDSISFGIPIVSVNCKSGPSEIVSDINGILVDQNSSELLGQAILQALDFEWNRAAILSDAKNRFGVSKFYNSYLDILK